MVVLFVFGQFLIYIYDLLFLVHVRVCTCLRRPMAVIRTMAKRSIDEAHAHEIAAPWNKESNFTKALPLDGGPNARARFHRPDIWHCIHLGVGKAFISSAFTVLQQAIPGSNVDIRFQSISEEYRVFCRARKLTPFLTKLDKFTFNAFGPMEEPAGSWNKASVTSTLGLFLEHCCEVFGDELHELGLRDHRVTFIVFSPRASAILFIKRFVCQFLSHAFRIVPVLVYKFCEVSAVRALNKMMHIFYHGDLWLPRPQATEAINLGEHFVRAYRYLAYLSNEVAERRFPLLPKLHMVDEIIEDLRFQVCTCQAKWCFNIICESCSVDDDFIGRCAFVCRHVSPRSTPIRTLERYLVQLYQVWASDA